MMKRQMLLDGILALAMTGCTTSAWAEPAPGTKVNQPVASTTAQPSHGAPAKRAAPMASYPTQPQAAGHDHGAGSAGGAILTGEGMDCGMMAAGMKSDCPMMAGAGTTMEVKNVAKGVVITLTSDDAAAVTKLQNMAARMQLEHQPHAH
jgi:hypothetical protein